jgi:flagellar biosynthesis protein FlhG
MLSKTGSKKLWGIGGGKGGIGKSIVTLGLGVSLARMGKRVISVDCDLGGANLHTLLGMRYPRITLEHFFSRKISRLEDTVIETPVEGLGLICGADDVLGAANPTYTQKLKFIRALENLPAQYVILDLSAGTSLNTLDLFNFCHGKIILVTPQTTSLQNAYGFIKTALYRKFFRALAKEDGGFQHFIQQVRDQEDNLPAVSDLLDRLRAVAPEQTARLDQVLQGFRIFILVNMVRAKVELKFSEILQSMCADFLRIQTKVLGYLEFDPALEPALNKMLPFLAQGKKTQAVSSLETIAAKVLRTSRLDLISEAWTPEKTGGEPRPEDRAVSRFFHSMAAMLGFGKVKKLRAQGSGGPA